MKLPSQTAFYRNHYTNNARWEYLEPRNDDIIICTASKSGTTWMQAICAHLIFQSSDLPAPVGILSPWLDLIEHPIDDVIADLDAQTHRRFIKTHTPLDGLPYFENVTYVHVSRHPLDVMFSLLSHMDNMKKALPGRDHVEDIDTMFDQWLATTVAEWGTVGGLSIDYLFHHVKTFWDFRDLPNSNLFHYTTLTNDLENEMHRLNNVLGIDTPEGLWPQLIAGVSFKNMKENADTFAPGADDDSWHDTKKFFAKGRSGESAKTLSSSQLERYRNKAAELASPKLITWIENGL